ncbi:MAG TPA: type I 3-dehydroquinate dehydratase [Vicinamibacterales bacterium]|nr:type I 3-dehydroquinate dehydratase [Vicinamibacterales bacterium]
MTRSLVCATVSAPTLDALVAERRRVEPLADLVELRLDGLRTIDVREAIGGSTRPVVVTCRPRSEGGRFDGSEEERHRILSDAVSSEADYVDIEWRAGFEDLILARGGRGVIVSMHRFDTIPVDLEGRVRAMATTGADVLKVAVRVSDLAGTHRLLQLHHQFPDLQLVVVGMGSKGIATRILPSRFGSAWTYAGSEHAAGQLALEDLIDTYRFRRIGASTAVYGIAGEPLAHSLSPAMHNAGFEDAEIDAVYLPFETSDPDQLLSLADALDVRGLSVTAPLKIALCERIRRQDEWVESVGSLNTLKRDEHGWCATNTDVPGFLEPLRDEELRGSRATIIGAGGAARAATAALRSRGAEVTIAARRRHVAVKLAGPGGCVSACPPEPGSWDLLVNATPVGTWPSNDASPVPAPLLSGGRIVYDLVYNPPVTRLLRDAAAAGCRTISGIEMLIAQAERQFEWWTGRSPASGLFRNVAHASYLL